jgi:formate hydrogenlyase subunit 6/NADH:ubiquinone oxidoreductase subunit I
MKVIERASLDTLFSVLKKEGYTIVGPTVREETIVYGELESPKDLPVGWTDEQDNGKYRLKRRDDGALFGFVVGPHAWKKFLFPSEHRLWSATYGSGEFQVKPEAEDTTKFAFVGVRSCELHAIQVQDKVFMNGPFASPQYRSRRTNVFTVAVNCTEAGGTCFCVSMKTGPKTASGFDLALTELIENGRHYFTVDVGSELGDEILKKVAHKNAAKSDETAADSAVTRAASQMGRTLDTTNIKELFYANLNHPRWDAVEKRCLACANCTMVCPTCFCTTVEDKTDLSGKHAERWRRWDSCFTGDFSFIVGGSIRRSTKSRYRQWITHKLAYWIDQFGTSGCVGCGRCITWCPVGIDITEEARAIREGPTVRASAGGKRSTKPQKEGHHGDD